MWRDRLFWLALAAGPLYWLTHALLIQPPTDLAWPLRQPGLFILPALIYPVLEEIVFRQLLQHQLLKPLLRYRHSGITAANVAASVVFSVSHALLHSASVGLAVFLPSLLFGFFRDRHQQLRSPIVLHVFYNCGYLWLFAPANPG